MAHQGGRERRAHPGTGLGIGVDAVVGQGIRHQTVRSDPRDMIVDQPMAPVFGEARIQSSTARMEPGDRAIWLESPPTGGRLARAGSMPCPSATSHIPAKLHEMPFDFGEIVDLNENHRGGVAQAEVAKTAAPTRRPWHRRVAVSGERCLIGGTVAGGLAHWGDPSAFARRSAPRPRPWAGKEDRARPKNRARKGRVLRSWRTGPGRPDDHPGRNRSGALES